MDNVKTKYRAEQPIRDSYLAYGRQWIDEEDIQAVVDVLKGDFLTTGPTINKFEHAVANYVGAKYAVAFSNGTAALHGACFAAGIEEGDEVITTPMTFAASANCVLYLGGKPVFADIDETYNINVKKVGKLITNKTKAIIPVDFTGQPVDLDSIMQLAKKHNLVVIEDAAHSLGATYKGKKVGSIADMTMFSFHPVKQITTGEGGIIATNSKLYYDKLIQFRSHGITRNNEQLFNKNEGDWYYEMQFLGFNYRMTDIQAALGTSQLKKLDLYVEKRRNIAKIYNEAFKDTREIKVPIQYCDGESSWHLYVIGLELKMLTVNRNKVIEALKKQNIGVNVHYIPVYLHPYYQKIGYKKGFCPNAEKIYKEIITLPLFPSMTNRDISDVINAVKKTIKLYSKRFI